MYHPDACQPGWTTDEGLYPFHSPPLHLACHQTTEKGKHTYLFLVLATNGNEANYTSKIDNFMLPN